MVRPSSRRSYRLLLACLLVALVLTPLAGIALASPRDPGVSDVVKLPAGADVAVTIEPSALARDAMPGLESRLAQMLAAYRAGDQEKLASFAGERHFNLAKDTVRVILEMARSPEAQAAGKPTVEVVVLPNGRQATIEHAPAVAIRPDLADAIAVTGATYETAYENWVQVLAPLDSLEALSQIAGVSYVRLPFPAQEQGVPARGSAGTAAPQATTSEGVVVTNADHWQAAGYNGTGVNLAVFDFGFTGWANRVAGGDLPAGVVPKDFSAAYSFNPDTAGYTHGTACAEIAYDMAPAATVYLYAWGTDVEFGNAVNDYISNVSGKRVATMSIGWVNAGPYDGTGSINTIVDGAQTAGIFWANSAGNYQKTHYSGTSTQYSTGDSVAFGTGNIEGYGPTSGSLWNISSGSRVTAFLEWNDWNAGRTGNQNHIDYDIFLLRWTGTTWTQVASSEVDQCGTTATPTEGIQYTVPAGGPYNYGVVIQRWQGGGACPNAFGHWLTLHSFLSAGASNLWWYVNNCNSVTIPADGNSAVATGATFWNEDGLAPLYGLEPFSSLGPRNAAGGGNPGVVVNKPDVVAPDGVSTATDGPSNGVNYAGGGTGFWGTSAASPHTAGLAADAWSRWPAYTQAQVRSYVETQALYKADGGTCGGLLAAATGPQAPQSGTQNNRYGWGRINLPVGPNAVALALFRAQGVPLAVPLAGAAVVALGLAVLIRRRRR